MFQLVLTMKKTFFIAALLLASAIGAAAQYADTIIGPAANYFNHHWYYQCPIYRNAGNRNYVLIQEYGWSGVFKITADDNKRVKNGREIVVPKRTAVKGIAAMLPIAFRDIIGESWVRCDTQPPLDEYLMIVRLSGDSVRIDSAVWDSHSTQRIMLLPRTIEDELAQTTPAMMRCRVVEAMFDTPVIVDSSFYIFGSRNNNDFVATYPGMGSGGYYKSMPTFYYMVAEHTSNPCLSHCRDSVPSVFTTGDLEDTSTWFYGTGGHFHFGPFFAIVDTDYYRLDVTAATDGGSVHGAATVRSMDTAAIGASPDEGFRFIGWNDGDTANPRFVEVWSDTAFAAFFAPTTPPEGIGSVDGREPCFAIAPVPADDWLSVSVAAAGQHTIRIYDNTGRTHLHSSFSGSSSRFDISRLPAGVYYVAVESDSCSGVKLFIKK